MLKKLLRPMKNKEPVQDNKQRKRNTFLIFFVLAIGVMGISDLKNTIGNRYYDIFIVVEVIIIALVTYTLSRVKPWEKTWKNLFMTTLIIVVSLLEAKPVANRVLIMTADNNKKIVMPGKIIGTAKYNFTTTKSGSNSGVWVRVLFDSGLEKSWRVRSLSEVYPPVLTREDHKVIENYQNYDKINVIAYESPLGLELRRFEVAE
ncbi:MAG TPA: hypothetical protein IAB06_03570 [Candidatus Avacidaminococcus intestinavium]|uniref:Uncharacterized protein n=1 Tax=Candidatus Avacidaminococcus intestinavium TaxID=2840684 RepID=A0A9D1MPI0_9FIRM|nr:hypothetical protein [Candidatus Avacidaminococcus intestinavium]